VASGTLEVRESITVLQNKVHKMMQTLFKDDQADSAVTEYDEVVELLTAAGDSQQGVLDSLEQRPPLWDEAGSELVTAVRQMQQALEMLTDQQSGDDSENSTESGEMDDYDYDENMEWSDSSESSSLFMPLNSSTFNSSLDARNMPVPNYTAEEIMAEEQQNALERSRRNEQRAGANVEKNW
jgi:hypothetical protein